MLYCPSGKLTDSKKKVRYRGETHAVLTVATPRMHGQHSVVAGIKHPVLSKMNDDFFLLVTFNLLVGVAQIPASHANQTPYGGHPGRSYPQGLANDARTMSASDISSLASRACYSRVTGKSRLEHPVATWAISRLTNEQPELGPIPNVLHVQGVPLSRSPAADGSQYTRTALLFF